MMYDHKQIESRWQESWARSSIYATESKGERPSYYVLDMFPYPSGKGLHVGHLKGYVASDVVARYKRACGFNVLHPMGWDSFGLPTERQAQREGIEPSEVTKRNVAVFKTQLQAVGLSYDWSREIATSSPDYYKWTQWIFCKLYERDLAYLAHIPVNWCPALGTVLANEEVMDGRYVETGDPVERRTLPQWMLRITAYADRLIDDLDLLDWPEAVKEMQRNWIGRSEGAAIRFAIASSSMHLDIFTTRPETLHGSTYVVIAPEHPLVDAIAPESWPQGTPDGWTGGESSPQEALRAYRAAALAKTDRARMSDIKTKTGVFTGAYAINPASGEPIPVFVADYVLMGYGTGAIMAVPAHDERDFEFARAFGLPIRDVVYPRSVLAMRYYVGAALEEESSGEDWSVVLADLLGYVTSYDVDPDGFAAALKLIRSSPRLPEHDLKMRQADARGSIDEMSGVLGSRRGTVSVTWQEAIEDFRFDSFGQLREWFAAGAFYEKTGAAFTGKGFSVNSGALDGLPTSEAKRRICEELEAKSLGKRTVQYKLRDWLFSRQRYWGEPIPVLHSPSGKTRVVSDAELPVELPTISRDVTAALGTDPVPPLGYAPPDWLSVLYEGVEWRRETNTMPQWAGSCWYYLRFISPHFLEGPVDPDLVDHWLPVNLYVGGAEHATLHLLYARFWHKFLYDIGVVKTREPFQRLFNQGMVHARSYRDSNGMYRYPEEVAEVDGSFVVRSSGDPVISQIEKMSKSKCNGVPPEAVIEEFGADALRLYEMFMGPVADSGLWDPAGVRGTRRFIERLWRLFMTSRTNDADFPLELKRHTHKTIASITLAIETFRLNTAVSDLMMLLNEAMRHPALPDEFFHIFARLLQPFAPHIAEEIWSQVGNQGSMVSTAPWPAADDSLLVNQHVEIAIQVNGKARAQLSVPPGTDQAALVDAAMALPAVSRHIPQGRSPTKIIYVSGRILNLVFAGGV